MPTLTLTYAMQNVIDMQTTAKEFKLDSEKYSLIDTIEDYNYKYEDGLDKHLYIMVKALSEFPDLAHIEEEVDDIEGYIFNKMSELYTAYLVLEDLYNSDKRRALLDAERNNESKWKLYAPAYIEDLERIYRKSLSLSKAAAYVPYILEEMMAWDASKDARLDDMIDYFSKHSKKLKELDDFKELALYVAKLKP